ncbi:Protein CBG12525 [Caenorhabditis briggsae]|uniref:Protein CBG12525 n=1 Tax=Caenorhabditis briggsae TaxID=6238 RepID=A8XFZ0_CAEBR|nr:Protein CBG12525 [Caenorhabditis briggsae]CAP31495.1 Protein CBG12525 [Caenorhabditis briggsae]
MSRKIKEAKKYLRNGKFTDAVDKFNEAGHELYDAGESDQAIEVLEEGAKIAREYKVLLEGSLCERKLSEIHAALGNRESSLQHLTAFRNLATQSGCRSQEQISHHVYAWCLQQLYTNGVAGKGDIERAIEMTKKSRELVGTYKKLFKPGDPGGPHHIRLAQLFTLEAQLENQLGNNEKALHLLDKTDRLLRPNDKSTRFEMLRTKCSIVPVSRRVDIAELMDDDAPEDKKAQTLCELSHQYILANRLEKGYKSLAQAYIFHEKQLSPTEKEDTTKRLCIIYRLVKYSRILKNTKLEPKLSMCELHEAVGDLYDQYFRTLMDKEKKEYRQYIRDNILRNYEKMLECKRNDEDELRAFLGMALVYEDLDEHAKSKNMFEKRLDLLKKTGAAAEKILDTKVSIFGCMCKLKSFGLEKVFDDLSKEVEEFDITKRELYDTWANYLLDNGDDEKSQKWRKAADEIPDTLIKDEDDETDILYGRLPDEEILERCREENELLKLDNLTEHQKHKTNDKGETILHQAAQKSDNEGVVEKLCRMGCKVDARDFGGWTPLSEAVAHDHLENVRVLIRYGADVNARSAESFISEESQSSSDDLNHSKLTPLMEACTNGFIDIAMLLIDNKARVDLKDSAGWTAYQHLRRYVNENGGNERMMKFCEYLKNRTSQCTDIPALTIRTTNRHEEAHSDDSPPDEIEDNIILGMAASRKRRNSNNSDNFSNSSKRVQRRSGENTRPSPQPPVPSRPFKKRSTQPSMPSYCQPKRLDHRNSSSSLNSIPRGSNSPRRSISPTATIRSAPSVYADDDDVQVVRMRKVNAIPQIALSSKTSPSVQRLIPSPRAQIDPKSTDMIVKCFFQLPPGNASDEIRPVKLPMRRSLSIAEVKKAVMTSVPTVSLFKIKSVFNKEDEDKCSIDELTLSQVVHKPDQREIGLVFELRAPPAHEVYEEISKNPNPEIINELKQLSTAKRLDLSSLFLNNLEMSEVAKSLSKCERPQNSYLNISFCGVFPKKMKQIFKILSMNRTKNKLEHLELFGIDFRDEGQILKILSNCSNVKSLNLSGLNVATHSYNNSLIPATITAFPNLVKLDLSFNSSWISDQNWVQMLKGLEKLEELIINETNTNVTFETDWLPSLSSFSSRGSDLNWDSIFEMLSISEQISRIDVRFSTCPPILPQELRIGNHRITEILY